MKTLILDGSIYPSFYNPVEHWTARFEGSAWSSLRISVLDRIPPELRLRDFTHLIVTGSEDRIVEPRPWHRLEAQIVKEAFKLGMPILGSCFGHQMLAREISGPEYTGASPTPEMGWLPVELTAEDPLLDGLKSPVWMFCSHFDEVHAPPQPWKVLARSSGCPVQIMRYGDRPVWGIQAHPEIRPGPAKALLKGFLEIAPEKSALIEPALEESPRDDDSAVVITTNFLKMQPSGTGRVAID